MADSNVPEQEADKAACVGLLDRIRGRLTPVGAALASFAAVGAVAGGLVGYWNVWKTVRTDVFPEKQKLQSEARARPDIVPRLSLVVPPFANLNNDPEQDDFAEGIATDLTTDIAQMPGAFVIGRGTAFTYKNTIGVPALLLHDAVLVAVSHAETAKEVLEYEMALRTDSRRATVKIEVRPN